MPSGFVGFGARHEIGLLDYVIVTHVLPCVGSTTVSCGGGGLRTASYAYTGGTAS